MSNFSNVDKPSAISNSSGGVWKIEKKRKARDKKNKQKYQGKEQKNREEDNSVLVDIDRDRDNDKEYEDQADDGLAKKKKSEYTKIDLKI